MVVDGTAAANHRPTMRRIGGDLVTVLGRGGRSATLALCTGEGRGVGMMSIRIDMSRRKCVETTFGVRRRPLVPLSCLWRSKPPVPSDALGIRFAVLERCAWDIIPKPNVADGSEGGSFRDTARSPLPLRERADPEQLHTQLSGPFFTCRNPNSADQMLTT
jgi:hypothetical protein